MSLSKQKRYPGPASAMVPENGNPHMTKYGVIDPQDGPKLQIMFPDDKNHGGSVNETLRTVCIGRKSFNIRVLPLEGPMFTNDGCFVYDNLKFQHDLKDGIRRILLGKNAPVGYVTIDQTRIELRPAEKWKEGELCTLVRKDIAYETYENTLNLKVRTIHEESKSRKRTREDVGDDYDDETTSKPEEAAGSETQGALSTFMSGFYALKRRTFG